MTILDDDGIINFFIMKFIEIRAKWQSCTVSGITDCFVMKFDAIASGCSLKRSSPAELRMRQLKIMFLQSYRKSFS